MAIVDAAIDQSGINFSTSTFYVGDTVRVYARVRNLGESDMTASVIFYRSDEVLGRAQPISLRAGGAPEEVFVDFVVPEGIFNVRAVLQGMSPEDENVTNNEATTPRYTPIVHEEPIAAVVAEPPADEEETGAEAETEAEAAAEVAVVVVATPAATTTSTATAQTVTASATVTAEASPEVSAPARPTSSYGIFTAADAAETGTAVAEPPSFFRMDNPWLSVLVVCLALALIVTLVAMVYLRVRHQESSSDEGDV